MGRRGKRRDQQRIITNPGSSTPWYYDDSTFKTKTRTDRRASSEFFAEFSSESLFSDSPSGNGLTDPYEVLGLFPGASIEQVKKAHRAMAKRYHPDRFATAPEPDQIRAQASMVKVNAAYAELMSRIDTDRT